MHKYRSIGIHPLLASVLLSSVWSIACTGSKPESVTNPIPTSTEPPQPPAKPVPVPKSISLTGCLQEGNSGAYILTDLNTPKRPDSSDPAVIGRETLAAAEHAYRLITSDKQDLSKLLGKRIHVEGTLSQVSDLIARNDDGRSIATAGQKPHQPKEQVSGRRVIKEDDLASVEISSVQRIANACGGRTAKKGKHPR